MNTCCKDEPMVEVTRLDGTVKTVCGCNVSNNYKVAA